MDKTHFKLCKELHNHQGPVRCVVCLSEMNFATSSDDRTILVWDSSSLDKPMKTLCGHERGISCLASCFDRKNRRINLFSGSHDSRAILWAPLSSSVEPIMVFSGHTGPVISLAINNAGTRLATGSWDKTARLWDVETGQCIMTFVGHEQSVSGLFFSPDGKSLVTASSDRTIRVWDLETGAQTRTYDPVHNDCIRSLVLFSGDGEALSSDNAGCLVHWSSSGHALMQYTEHRTFIYNIFCSNSATGGSFVLTSGEDRAVKIWKNFKVTQSLNHPSTVWTSTVLGNGDIATCCDDGVVRIWTEDESKAVSDSAMQDYEASLKSNIASGAADYDVFHISELERKRGRYNGDVAVFSDGRKQMAYQWVEASSSWTKIGDVVNGDSSQNVYQGVEYDYVFDVELDGRKWKLPYNMCDNPYVVAQKFIDDNNLQQEMLDDIGQFIWKQTEHDPRRNLSTSHAVDPFTGGNAYDPAKERSYPGKVDAALLPGYHPPPQSSEQQPQQEQKQQPQSHPPPSSVPLKDTHPFGVANIPSLFAKLKDVSSTGSSDSHQILSFDEAVALELSFPTPPSQSILEVLCRYPPASLTPVCGYLSLLAQNPDTFISIVKAGFFTTLCLDLFSACPQGSPQRQLTARTLANASSTPRGTEILFSKDNIDYVNGFVVQALEDRTEGTRAAVCRMLFNAAVNGKSIPEGDITDRFIGMYAQAISGEFKEKAVVNNALLAIATFFYNRRDARESVRMPEICDAVRNLTESEDEGVRKIATQTLYYIAN